MSGEKRGACRSPQELLADLKKLAQDNGYELLESKWLGTVTKHRFRHIESGKELKWRPRQLFSSGFPLAEGQRFVTQEVIRQVFSHIFGGEFNTDRDRLKARNNGRPLELDGYEHFQATPDALKRLTGHHNEGREMAFNLSVAFEFQGHPSHRENKKTIRRDKLKADLCQVEGIHLMQIDPDLEDESRFWANVRDSDFMYAYVCKAIASHFGRDIDFPPGFKIDLSNWNPDKKAFQKLKELAQDNGFELLETQWLGSQTKHRFRHIESGNSCECKPAQLFSQGFPNKFKHPPTTNPTPPQPEIPTTGPTANWVQLTRINGVPLPLMFTGERLTVDSLRKVLRITEAFKSLLKHGIPERLAFAWIQERGHDAVLDLIAYTEQRDAQQASQPAEPELGPLMDHETEAHADLDEPDEQSLPVESCC